MEVWKDPLEDSKSTEKPPIKKMKFKRMFFSIAVLAVICAGIIFFYIYWPQYELITLESLGGSYGTAEAINNNGQVAGWCKLPNNDCHAFIWDADKGIRDLGTLGGKNSFARDINDKGQVVGSYAYSYDPYPYLDWNGFFWDSKTNTTVELAGIYAYADNGETQIVHLRNNRIMGFTAQNAEYAIDLNKHASGTLTYTVDGDIFDGGKYRTPTMIWGDTGYADRPLHSESQIIRSATSVDLSGAAEILVVFHTEKAFHILKATLLYTEASSADAGIAIKMGKETDDDYYYSGTSETSKSQWYSKDITLNQPNIDAGDSVLFYSAGGKAGTGEIMLIIELVTA